MTKADGDGWADEGAPRLSASVHLVGGGRDEARCAALLSPFSAAVAAVAGEESLVVALLLVLEADDDVSQNRFRSLLTAAGVPAESLRTTVVLEGRSFDPSAVEGAHGIFVGGGLTPAYHEAVVGATTAIRSRVAAGAVYGGFSAGAAIASVSALVGGFRHEGVPVSPEDAAEELDEVEVRPGLGLIAETVDVHAAQWGTVSRLIAAVEGGLAPRGWAIDEYTAVIATPSGGVRVHGEGRVWSITAGPSGGTVVSTVV